MFLVQFSRLYERECTQIGGTRRVLFEEIRKENRKSFTRRPRRKNRVTRKTEEERESRWRINTKLDIGRVRGETETRGGCWHVESTLRPRGARYVEKLDVEMSAVRRETFIVVFCTVSADRAGNVDRGVLVLLFREFLPPRRRRHETRESREALTAAKVARKRTIFPR